MADIAPADNFRRDRSVSVMDRARPGYDPVPVSFGGFDLLAALASTADYDDNVFARSDDRQSDFIGIIKGSALVRSDWTTNSLDFRAQAQHDGNVRFGSESVTSGGIGADGALDVTRSLQVTGTLQYDHLFEPRLSSGAPTFTRNPVEYNRALAQIGLTETFNRLRLTVSENHRLLHFENAETPEGAIVYQGYRNEDRDRVTARLDYAVSPNTSVFVEALGNFRHYNSQTGSVLIADRDSKGAEVTTGVSLDLPKLVRGEASVGYLEQTFSNPLIHNASGIGARGLLEFFPTGLTTVTLSALREFSESALVTSPLVLYTDVGIGVDHELYRNIILRAKFDYEKDEYQGVNRTDDRPAFSVGVIYYMNRWIKWEATDAYLHQNSMYEVLDGLSVASAGQSFSDNQVSLTMTVSY